MKLWEVTSELSEREILWREENPIWGRQLEPAEQRMSSLKFYEERRPSIVYEENIVVRRKGVTMTVRADSLYVSVI